MSLSDFYGNKLMSQYEEVAWELLTKDMAFGLHQFDSWEQVPEKVKKLYLDKAIKES